MKIKGTFVQKLWAHYQIPSAQNQWVQIQSSSRFVGVFTTPTLTLTLSEDWLTYFVLKSWVYILHEGCPSLLTRSSKVHIRWCNWIAISQSWVSSLVFLAILKWHWGLCTRSCWKRWKIREVCIHQRPLQYSRHRKELKKQIIKNWISIYIHGLFVVKLYFSRVHGRLSKTKAMEPLRHPRAISQTRDLERFQILCGHVPLGPLVPTDLLTLNLPSKTKTSEIRVFQQSTTWTLPEGAAELQAV